MSTSKDRAPLVSLLRALADLLEGNETGDAFHSTSASFFPDTAGETTAIMSGLPLSWKAGKSDSEYQHINGKAPHFDVTIFAKAADVSTQAGVVETPVWAMRPEIAALMEGTKGQSGGETA